MFDVSDSAISIQTNGGEGLQNMPRSLASSFLSVGGRNLSYGLWLTRATLFICKIPDKSRSIPGLKDTCDHRNLEPGYVDEGVFECA